MNNNKKLNNKVRCIENVENENFESLQAVSGGAS